MSTLPYSVLRQLPGMIRSPASGYAVPAPLVEPEVLRTGSRRRRLWELPHKFHCPLVGVCFACDELRGLMKRVMHFPPDATDFLLHTTAVGACEQRSQLAELLHKTLEARYRLKVKALAAIRSNVDLRAAWQQACASGADIPATLWACWTHPAVDAALEQEIFADIHMLQHQLGSGTRADLKAMQVLRSENADLRQQLQAANVQLEQVRSEKVAAAQTAAVEISDARAELAAAESRCNRHLGELEQWRERTLELRENDALSDRLARAQARIEEFRLHTAALEKEVARLREFASYAEETIELLSQEDSGSAAALVPEAQLSGKAVLCVGGRSGALDSYRAVVEQSGGRFLHHDGGIEESLHRIDNAVAAADVVICQVGCISHNAYWRVKEHCKRTGKPCMYVKNAGVTSFGRVVGEVGKTSA